MVKSRFFRLACAFCCVGLLLIAVILLQTNRLGGMEMNLSLDRVQLDHPAPVFPAHPAPVFLAHPAPVFLAHPAPQENLWIELYNKNTLVSFN